MRGGAENALGNGEWSCLWLGYSFMRRSAASHVNLLLLVLLAGSGKKVTCVFGFCKIDDFTSICSGLEEDVCTYINTIAYIVHHGVVQWNGAPNKNTGSAFFCVWKLPDDRPYDASRETDAPQVRLAGSNRDLPLSDVLHCLVMFPPLPHLAGSCSTAQATC